MTPKCIQCDQQPVKARGLCKTCWQIASRNGELELYPTQQILNDPDAVARILIRHFPDSIRDVAVEFDFKL